MPGTETSDIIPCDEVFQYTPKTEGANMNGDIEIISDDEGLTVLGNPTDVEQFLSEQGFVSEPLGEASSHDGIRKAGAFGGTALQAGADVMQNSGRWVKLTSESTEKIKQFGLIVNKQTGLKTGVIGKGGRGGIVGNVQFENLAGAAATLNPAALANIGVMMSQMAMQQTLDQITDYLAVIDEKVDDVLRAQKDAVLSDMIGVGLIIEDAMRERQITGHVADITWDKIAGAPMVIASTQAYALRQLDAVAEKLQSTKDTEQLMKASKRSEATVNEWLAVLGKCIQLQDTFSLIELDRVLGTTPEELNNYRRSVMASRQKRLELFSRSVNQLETRIQDVCDRVNGTVLFHPLYAPATVESGKHITASLGRFAQHVDLDLAQHDLHAKQWVDTAGEAAQIAGKVLDDTAKAVVHGGADAAAAVGSQAKKVADAGAQGVDQAVKGTAKALSVAGDAAGSVLNDTGKAIGDTANQAGKAIGNAANQAGKAIAGLSGGLGGLFKRR